MSDPYVGAVAQLLLNSLSNIVTSEIAYAQQFRPQLDELESHLVPMQSFLIEASKSIGYGESIREIVNVLRELIYEADDVIVDCQIHGDHLIQMSGCDRCCYICLHEFIFRYQIGKKLANINIKIDKASKKLRTYGSVMAVSSSLDDEESSRRRRRWTSQIVDQSELVGLTEDTEMIKSWILSGGGDEYSALHQIIGIVGMGGLGKTTLAQNIVNDQEIMNAFTENIWVSVSQTVDEVKMLKSMLKQLQADASGDDTGNLLTRISRRLKNTSYIIVMDDVWRTEEWWESIYRGLPKPKVEHRSCIIVTSRIEDQVRRMKVVEERICRARFLNEDNSWKLFCKVAFESNNGECIPQLEEVGRQIMLKCGGLPLAIKATAGLLSLKPPNVSDWERVSEEYHRHFGGENEAGKTVMASLQLSYDHLPHHLKNCMLSFSVFPEDQEIDADQVVHWWVGESFVRDKGDVTATEVANDYMEQLISRCLIQAVDRRKFNGRVYKCKVHDLIRDLVIKIAMKEAFCNFDERDNRLPGTNTRRMGLTKETANFQVLRGNTKLRALLLTTYHCIDFTGYITLENIKSLRVLDLSHLELNKNVSMEEFWRWITSLPRLAYLNLSYVGILSEVPHSIKRLWGLQVFILRGCASLKKLPQSLTTLSGLKILDVGNCPSLRCLPRGLSKLVLLRELYGFKVARVNDAEGCSLGDLKRLKELQVLQLEITNETTIDEAELAVLECLPKLRVLSINAGEVEDKELLTKLSSLSPPRGLRELYLRQFHGDTTPAWMNPISMPKLSYLCIESSRTINRVSTGFWGNEGNRWKVEGLCLKHLPQLNETWEAFQTMKGLRYLEYSNCNSLKSFPSIMKVSGYGCWRKKKGSDGNHVWEDIAVRGRCTP